MCLVLWGNLFYELRCSSESKLKKAWQRVFYNVFHWVSLLLAAAMASAYAVLVVEPTNGWATFLSFTWVCIGWVLLAAIGYLSFKGPLMWGEAEEEERSQ